jgi:hypothetical protein
VSRRREKRSLPLAPKARHAWTPALLEGLIAGEAAVIGDLLRTSHEDRPEVAALQAAVDVHQLILVELRRPGAELYACKPGCPSCCSAKVVAIAPEIFRIVTHLRATLDEAALAALIERVREADAKTRGLTRAAREELRLPCPLLREGSCSIHLVRPLHCVGWTSFDAGACERYWEAPSELPAPPHHVAMYELASAGIAALGRACFESGLDGTPLELIAALRIALERPNAKARWLAQLPVFSTARDAEWMERNGMT